MEQDKDDKDDDEVPTKHIIRGNGRPYVFYASQFLTDEEYMSVFREPKDLCKPDTQQVIELADEEEIPDTF